MVCSDVLDCRELAVHFVDCFQVVPKAAFAHDRCRYRDAFIRVDLLCLPRQVQAFTFVDV